MKSAIHITYDCLFGASFNSDSGIFRKVVQYQLSFHFDLNKYDFIT